MTFFKLSSYTAVVLLAAAFTCLAQQRRPDFNRPQTFDAQHYTIRTSFDRNAKKVSGDTSVTVRPLKPGFRALELDSEGLAYQSIRIEPGGQPLTFQTLPGKVVVTLDRAYGPEDTVTVRFAYSAYPKKGVYFVPASTGHSAQIWTQGEPDEARHWFPSFDFPSDKATTEQVLTVEKGETVIANGELVSRTENENGTETWHYRMPVPHPVYLVSFVIGKYVKVEEKYKDIPLGYYVYPGRETTARNAYGETREMMRIMEELTGVPYPYSKYDQTMVAAFQFGGMENITATTMADTEIFLADIEFGKPLVLDLVSHELAHSWFGNLVTCRNWAELWLNEGFATFMEAVYLEESRGRDVYLRKIRSDAAEFLINDLVNRRKHGLFNLRANDVSALFDNPAVTYHKGGAVVHTLREQIGNQSFWKAINKYLNRHKFASVESTDLRRAMEESSGQDLGWFFDQWVYGGGAPRLDVRPVFSARNRTLTLTISQTQVVDGLTPAVFRLPLDVAIKGLGDDTTIHRIEMTRRTQSFTLPATKRPTGIDLDPNEKIPLKRVKVRPVSIR